uniref:Transmembrane protein 53 n=1 Tax=Tetradesmus obliquus TaxID=3088 RepID=A0A383WCI3_TETOB|eukprot:jgi/Sobl393_1/50/SZX74789.1
MASQNYSFRISPAALDNGDVSRPLVVLLGWYGASDKHLAKYSRLLAGHGYGSVRGTMSGAAIFLPLMWPRVAFATALLELLDGLGEEQQLVFYVFSNGGAFPLEQVDALLQQQRFSHLSSRIAGVIFDSAPCYMHPTTGAEAIGIGCNLPVRVLAWLLFYALVLLGCFVAPLRPWQYWRSMRQLRMAGGRCLYLYSADDPLCDAAKLDELVAARKQQYGAAVAAKKWQHSKHVGHLLCHADEYTKEVLQFLSSVSQQELAD